jgi:hypothetical protein
LDDEGGLFACAISLYTFGYSLSYLLEFMGACDSLSSVGELAWFDDPIVVNFLFFALVVGCYY